MTLFLCKLWPYLAGGLIGWLLAGWLARRLRNAEPPVEKIIEKEVEKVVDNPEHLSLISKLETENSQIPDLMTKLSGFESAEANIVEKVVEVDNPKLVSQIATLKEENRQIQTLRSRISELEGAASGSVSQNVEKTVDNPAHLAKISELEAQIKAMSQGPAIDIPAARAAGISIKSENDFTAIEGIGPKINDLIHAEGITSFANLSNTKVSKLQSTLDKAGANYAMANPGTWPDQANLAANNRWPALKALQDVLDGGVYPAGRKADSADSSSTTSSASSNVTTVDVSAAKAAGFRVKQIAGQNDFTVVEGIGPKINELIHEADIHSYGALAQTAVASIRTILDNAGPRYKLARPDTWPKQAELAASNQWDALKNLQDELDGGV